MPGKRVRAKHGPEEDRAHHKQEDRGARLRIPKKPDRDTEGLSEKDAARMKAFKGD